MKKTLRANKHTRTSIITNRHSVNFKKQYAKQACGYIKVSTENKIIFCIVTIY